MASALKHSSWKDLLEKLEARLFLWTHRALNMASRIVLIKAILHSMPLYIFSLLAVPKWVLKEIKNLQRNFLWGSSGPNRKWALVKRENVCLPKKVGGIRLRDPEHSNKVMGAKIWWRWLAYPNTPWASLWTEKYASNNPIEYRICMSEVSTGSVVWNSAIQHRDLIQKNIFWEIKSGNKAIFWEDSSQQLPHIKDIFHNLPLPVQGINQSAKVNQFWNPSPTQKYRKWKEANQILMEGGYELTQHSLSLELKKWQIPIAEGPDILIWGYEERGTFTTREEYKIIIKEQIIKDTLWDKLWNSSNWLKVSTFLWLLYHNKILTWDNLRKIIFSGPSISLNSKQEEESTIHLMQTCQIGWKLWEKVSFRCQKYG